MAQLDIEALLRELGAAGIVYVLTGSVAAAAYGVPVEPRDLDIAPELSPQNLSRIADLLRRWSAKPQHVPDWPEGLSREECERWLPEPATAEHLDHLFTTPHGLFDVVPARSGAYPDLSERALRAEFEGRTVWIAHPADLIATMRPHKDKHLARLPRLRDVLDRLERGEPVVPVLPIGDHGP